MALFLKLPSSLLLCIILVSVTSLTIQRSASPIFVSGFQPGSTHTPASTIPPLPKSGQTFGRNPTQLEAIALDDVRGGANEGSATIQNEVFNLVKNIVGAGVLSLPAGVAAFGNAPSALIPATVLISFIGLMSGYCFSLIGRVCQMTGATSYRSCWEKSVGESSSWFPASACTFKTGAANIAYSMILADTFKALAATAGYR